MYLLIYFICFLDILSIIFAPTLAWIMFLRVKLFKMSLFLSSKIIKTKEREVIFADWSLLVFFCETKADQANIREIRKN